jgi:hypothetical protein
MRLHEIKKLCITKEMVSKLKRSPIEWEKIFAGYTSDKGTDIQNIQSSKN